MCAWWIREKFKKWAKNIRVLVVYKYILVIKRKKIGGFRFSWIRCLFRQHLFGFLWDELLSDWYQGGCRFSSTLFLNCHRYPSSYSSFNSCFFYQQFRLIFWIRFFFFWKWVRHMFSKMHATILSSNRISCSVQISSYSYWLCFKKKINNVLY